MFSYEGHGASITGHAAAIQASYTVQGFCQISKGWQTLDGHWSIRPAAALLPCIIQSLV
jgi:hypothetical protein